MRIFRHDTEALLVRHPDSNQVWMRCLASANPDTTRVRTKLIRELNIEKKPDILVQICWMTVLWISFGEWCRFYVFISGRKDQPDKSIYDLHNTSKHTQIKLSEANEEEALLPTREKKTCIPAIRSGFFVECVFRAFRSTVYSAHTESHIQKTKLWSMPSTRWHFYIKTYIFAHHSSLAHYYFCLFCSHCFTQISDDQINVYTFLSSHLISSSHDTLPAARIAWTHI